MSHVTLRDVEQDDFRTYFENQLDPDANWMAAFTSLDPADREAFMARCAYNCSNPDNLNQTVLVDGHIAGYVASFIMDGKREVGYWIGKSYWGKGVASAALAIFLRLETRRPLFAQAAKDNSASVRVLLKCGFAFCGEGRAFSNARGMEVDEVILKLDALPVDTPSGL